VEGAFIISLVHMSTQLEQEKKLTWFIPLLGGFHLFFFVFWGEDQ
jgi:hypothetical protein